MKWFKASRKSKSDLFFDVVIYGFAILLILLIVYPLWFVVIASFSNPSDVANGKKWLSVLYIVPMFVSGGLIPIYLTVKSVGLVDSFWVMVVPFAVSSYNIIVARTFFNNSIPEGMWEAAQIDGCGTIRYFFKIVVPLSKAIIAVIGLWTAVGIWNSWFNALIYLTKENLQPLQLILRRLLISNQMMQSQATGELASDLRIKADMMKYAAIVISTAPIMLLYPFVQKYFNQGVMIGALKE